MILIQEPKTGYIKASDITTINGEMWILVRGYCDVDFVTNLQSSYKISSSQTGGGGLIWDLSLPGPDGVNDEDGKITVSGNAWYGWVKIASGDINIRAEDEIDHSHEITIQVLSGDVTAPTLTKVDGDAYTSLTISVDQQKVTIEGEVDPNSNVEWIEIEVE